MDAGEFVNMKETKINNEDFSFIYVENVLPEYTYSCLIEWLQCQEYKSGKCISGKVIPRLQNWYQIDKKYFCDKPDARR